MRTRLIQARTGRDAVYAVCRALLDEGSEVSPRGQRTLELSPVHLELLDPLDALPDAIGRKRLTPAIAAAEALQNIAGTAHPGLMHRISKFFPKPTGRWSEGVETYGPRIGPQMDDVVELLRRDPETREAVVAIWREGDVASGQAHNLCTVSLQFLMRRGELDLFVTMRSNDAWYGLTYDLFQFAQVQATLARCLGVPVGRYSPVAASMHLYERHWPAADELHAPPPDYTGRPLDGIGWANGQQWSAACARAHALLHGGHHSLRHLTPTEQWYVDTLAPYDPADN